MYGPKWPFYSFLSVCGPDVVVVKCWDRLCILGRAPRIKENLLDFHEWCQVTRHPRIFRGLTGCQRDPGEWGVTDPLAQSAVQWCIHIPGSLKSRPVSPILYPYPGLSSLPV